MRLIKRMNVFIMVFLVIGITMFGISFAGADELDIITPAADISMTGNTTPTDSLIAEDAQETSAPAVDNTMDDTALIDDTELYASSSVRNRSTQIFKQQARAVIPVVTAFSDSTTSQKFVYVSNTSTLTAGYATTQPADPLNIIYYSKKKWVSSRAASWTAPPPLNWYYITDAPFGSGAYWISTAPWTEAGTGDQWRLYQLNFTIPEGATLTSAQVWYTADNAVAVYFNESMICNAGTVYGNSSETTPLYQYAYNATFTPEAGLNTLKFVVRNWASSGENPTGLLYKVAIEYEPLIPPVANFTATPTSGTAPLIVQFNDTSSGSPTSWLWDFGDGDSTNSTVQNATHSYTSAGMYTVNLTVANAAGNDTMVKTDYVTVTEEVANCGNPTDPYINFVIENVSCPEYNYGAWRIGDCYHNTVIRWAKAGESSPFYTNLSPWMWKRTLSCPDPGHSWAIDAPANKPIYYAAVVNSDTTNVWYHHHAVAAEYLAGENASNSTFQDWNFFNYNEQNITIGWYHQIPNATSISDTTVTINHIKGVYGCGQTVADPVISFTIDQNNSVSPHPAVSYPNGYIVNNTVKTQFINQIIPDDLKNFLQSINDRRQFTISKWEFDPTSKKLTLYAYDINNPGAIAAIEEESIGKYPIRVVHDTEFEKTQADIQQRLTQLIKNPDYQIAGTTMIEDTLNDPPENYVQLWVYQSTPENKRLDNTIINGWKIVVYPMSPLPSDTGTL